MRRTRPSRDAVTTPRTRYRWMVARISASGVTERSPRYSNFFSMCGYIGSYRGAPALRRLPAHRIACMLSVDEALALIASRVPLGSVEAVPLEHAAGRVLAREVRS